MYVYENETCDLLCEATLYMMQQVRESVGRERSRIKNILVLITILKIVIIKKL